MTTKSKTTFIILGTLIIGIVIGALASGMWREKRIKKFSRMRPQQQFVETIEEIIKPDDAQRKAIEKVLEKRFEHIAQIRERHESEMMAVFDSLRQELNSLLTEEQLKRLEENLEKSSHRFRDRRLDRLTDVLQLTEDQRRQIEEIFRRNGPDFRRFRKPPARDSIPGRFDFMEQRKKLEKEIEALLTPEQRKKYEEFRKEGGYPLKSRHRPGFGKPGLERMFKD
jgi:Spy/CpxP family protein refolding chaperone